MRIFPAVLWSLVVLSIALSARADKPKEKPENKSRPASIVWVNELPGNKELPPNTSHHTFHSETAGQEIGYCLYLPPGYAEDSERRYPVIYNLHGNRGNEFHSFEDVEVLHEGILAGRWPPMIVALPNGGTSTFYKDSHDGKFPIETIFITEFIPHVDQSYRTIASGSGRCIEGFSMGGRGSLRLAMKYPEMFLLVVLPGRQCPCDAAEFRSSR